MLSEIVHVMLIRIFPPLGGGTFQGNLLISQLDLTWNSCCSVEHVALHTILGGRKLAANLFDKPNSSHLFSRPEFEPEVGCNLFDQTSI